METDEHIRHTDHSHDNLCKLNWAAEMLVTLVVDDGTVAIFPPLPLSGEVGLHVCRLQCLVPSKSHLSTNLGVSAPESTRLASESP